jgi:hypothetical protein
MESRPQTTTGGPQHETRRHFAEVLLQKRISGQGAQRDARRNACQRPALEGLRTATYGSALHGLRQNAPGLGGGDMMTVANVFLAFLVVAILSIWPLTKWAIRSLKELDEEAQKWRIGNHD